jgi:hypothetical protein
MCIDGLIVEPRTIARLPLQSTDHAKLRCAPARHVVAAFFELDHGRTTVASLPALLLGNFDECFRLRILRTVPRDVHFLRTYAAHPCFALLAPPDFPTILNLDIVRFDPGAASPSRAIYSVLRLEFSISAVPQFFELLIEELVHVFQVDVLIRTTSRRHVSRVLDGHGEDALEARMAHAVSAR